LKFDGLIFPHCELIMSKLNWCIFFCPSMHENQSCRIFQSSAVKPGTYFRLAVEVKFDWYSLDKPCFVSTICIREYSNVWTSFQTAQHWMSEMHRIIAVFTSFCTYDFGWQNYGRKWVYFPITSWRLLNHTEVGRIRGFDIRLAIEVKFDWYSFDKPCLGSCLKTGQHSIFVIIRKIKKIIHVCWIPNLLMIL
jgi:hypothetical protein